MATKLLVVALFAVAVNASGQSYSYSYGVNDPHAEDVKNQHERRVGDSVVGQYSLLESERAVNYAANLHTGFNAVFRRDPPHGVHPPPAAYVVQNAVAPTTLAVPAAYGAGYSAGYTGSRYAGIGVHTAPLAYAGHTATLAHVRYGAAGYGAAGYGTAGYGARGHSAAGYGATGYAGPYGNRATSYSNQVSYHGAHNPYVANAYSAIGAYAGHGGWVPTIGADGGYSDGYAGQSVYGARYATPLAHAATGLAYGANHGW